MPTYLKRQVVRGVVDYISRPLFVGYIFVENDLPDDDRMKAVAHRRGVKNFLPAWPARPIGLTAHDADIIASACSEDDDPLELHEANTLLGKLVRITEGSYADRSGLCESIERSAARVILTMFGRACPVKIETKQLALL